MDLDTRFFPEIVSAAVAAAASRDGEAARAASARLEERNPEAHWVLDSGCQLGYQSGCQPPGWTHARREFTSCCAEPCPAPETACQP